MTSVYGIDLGTTFCACATLTGGQHINLPLDENRMTLASQIWLERRSDGGLRACVGQTAIESSIQPDGTGTLIRESKRFIGRPYGGRKEPPWNFEGASFDPRDAAALILGKIKQRVSLARPTDPLRRAVITHPANFPISAKNATKEAGELAGIEVFDTITEPGAAARAYGVTQQTPGNYLVFDLGGGTLDVTLLEILKGGNIALKLHDGISELGGVDWDRQILTYVKNQFAQTYPDFDFDGMADRRTETEWLQKACTIKERLSRQNMVIERFECEINGEPLAQKIAFSKEQFERLGGVAALVAKCRECLLSVLASAHLRPADIMGVLLVGGSTKMPMIERMVEEASGKKPLTGQFDRDLCVATGAAYRGREGEKSTVEVLEMDAPPEDTEAQIAMPKVQDCTALSLRVLARRDTGGDFCQEIIPFATSTPCNRDQVFVTVRDNATEIPVRVYEGASEEKDGCTFVGEVRIRDLPPRPAGQKVRVEFQVSDGGRLTVKAEDVATGKSVEARLDVPQGSGRSGGAPIDLAQRRQELEQIEIL
jgi:molecular chaperone DnaK